MQIDEDVTPSVKITEIEKSNILIFKLEDFNYTTM